MEELNSSAAKLREISHYIGDHELSCKICGSVSNVDNVVITQHKHRWKGSCPDCDAFIKWMPTAKISLFWMKGSLHPMGDMDNGLLMWIVKKSAGSLNNQKFARAILLGRLDSADVPDIQPTTKEIAAADDYTAEQKEIIKLRGLIRLWQAKAIEAFKSSAWDATAQEKAANNIKTWKQRISFLSI